MLAPSVHPLLWLFGCVLFQGTTASTDSSIHTVTDQPRSTTHSPEVENHTPEPSIKSTAPDNLNPISMGQSTTAKSSSIATTFLASTVQDKTSHGSRSTTASSTQGQEPKRSESTATPTTQGTSNPVTPTPKPSGFLPVPTPTDDKSPLTVAAFGVISFIVILIVVVIILVSVVSLRFKCNRSKDSEDKQKPGTSMVSERWKETFRDIFETVLVMAAGLEGNSVTQNQIKLLLDSARKSCSAGPSQKDNSITLISMKNINTNNSMSYPPSEKVL